jgi:hypothetical protein
VSDFNGYCWAGLGNLRGLLPFSLGLLGVGLAGGASVTSGGDLGFRVLRSSA